jgi:hypothetical protein
MQKIAQQEIWGFTFIGRLFSFFGLATLVKTLVPRRFH